jgi:GTP-binding protein Era
LRSGFVALIGRPNVGKSTLLNRLVGRKLSITSQRPQTTRHRILGIKTTPQAQVIYIDSPGLHHAGDSLMNRYLNRTALASLAGADCIVLVIEGGGWRPEDERVLAAARAQHQPVILAINKADRLKNRSRLLPLIEASRQRLDFAAIVPVSARTGLNLGDLEQAVLSHLPQHPAYFAPDQVGDRSERFMAAELVREQVFRGFGQEVPYGTAVEIEQFQREPGLLRVTAVIWTEKEGQKAILIGKGGVRMKEIGKRARLEMERLFGVKVYLELWVKVGKGWSGDERILQRLGYTEEP